MIRDPLATMTAMTKRAVTYSTYLAIDEILAAQRPLSVGPDGRPEHDELLFIVIHQVYELWFKQLLHELAEVQRTLEAGDTDTTLHLLNRILKILKTLVAQIDVLETMTPLQFTSFRDRLESASGFQSAQFREVEAVLGKRDASAVAAQPAGSDARARVEAAQARRSVWHSYLRFLAARGHELADDVLARDVTLPPQPDERVQDVLVALYREDADGALVAERLVDLDEGFQEWRYRHVKMVERTIGTKRGTGGSAGVEYLRTTLFQPVFPDLWEIRGRL
jgi:tryptophan 2,3-dioxygenase